MDGSKIEWTDATWNPLRGCSRTSPGCLNCYAERVAARFSGPGMPYEGLAKMVPGFPSQPRWTGQVRLVEEHLDDPLRWRKPRRIFVNSMSDLFHEKISDNWIEAIFGIMAAAQQHTFQVLTKRPERMLQWFQKMEHQTKSYGRHTADLCVIAAGVRMRKDSFQFPAVSWPLPNVWLGVSVEDQANADVRIPLLLQTPAAVRWISAEPLLGPLDPFEYVHHRPNLGPRYAGLDWVVVGGESGPGARPFDVEWARSIVGGCKAAGVPAFVKQLGAYPVLDQRYNRTLPGFRTLCDKKGGDPTEWPGDLRVREYPKEATCLKA